MLTKILNILAPDISISVTPEKFSFKRGDTEKEFTTKLYLSLDQNKPKIVGVGDEMYSSAANRCIEIFKTENKYPTDLCKLEILDAFFKHAIRAVISKVTFVRPRIIVIGSESLENVLCGFQTSILKQSLVNAGAREVIFKQKNV